MLSGKRKTHTPKSMRKKHRFDNPKNSVARDFLILPQTDKPDKLSRSVLRRDFTKNPTKRLKFESFITRLLSDIVAKRFSIKRAARFINPFARRPHRFSDFIIHLFPLFVNFYRRFILSCRYFIGRYSSRCLSFMFARFAQCIRRSSGRLSSRIKP